MSRTIAQIQQAIIGTKDAEVSLSTLTSPSAVAVWKLWTYIVAVAIWFHENLWDVFKAEVTVIANSQKAGTAAWYQQQVFLWQEGDALVFVDYVPTYNPIDVTHRIVTRCAVIDGDDGVVTIKVAKSEPPEPLTLAQITVLEGYVDDIKFAGTFTQVLSKPADLLKVNGTVYYDGSYIVADLKTAVAAAVDAFLAALPFNGDVVLSDLIDIIKEVPGVNDMVITSAIATVDGGSPVTINRVWPSSAGWMVIDPGNLLAATLTYTIG